MLVGRKATESQKGMALHINSRHDICRLVKIVTSAPVCEQKS
jgi:hypothetical protein